MDYYENLLWLYKVADHKGYSNLKKTSKRRDNALLDSGYYSTQACGALNKCWKGYKIAKSEDDTVDMEHYAKGIRKFQRELKISVSEFPQLGLIGGLTDDEERDSNNEWAGRNSGDVRKEIENRELQEHEQDPFSIEHEPDPRKEQEEYFRRIHQEWIDPGSSE